MTRHDFEQILAEDAARSDNYRPSLKDKLLSNESWYIFHFIRHLRYVEYYKEKGALYKILYLYHFLKLKRLSFKLHITIYPNTIAGGLKLYHVGDFTHVGSNCRIGRNCTILPGVVFGNKYENETIGETIVGDNCYFGLGARIFGPLTIGNNVIVGANSVIIKDIPDNAIVAGAPAKIIRIKEQ